jgi:C2 domain
MKYLPIKMKLDPSESINNQGEVRVDILDAADLPSADRNGYSDPYCQFKLNGESVYKTKVQKKTLHPAWNEYFTTNIPSRTAAEFKVKVMDWDIGGGADFLGDADIHLEGLEPNESKEITLALNGKNSPATAGVLRLRLLFKSAYVTRSRRGTATFSGTIGPAGKVIGAPVKVVGKVGTGVGGGLAKGASFMFGRGKNKGEKGEKGDRTSVTQPTEQVTANGTAANGEAPIPSIETPERSKAQTDGSPAPFDDRPEARRLSFGGRSASAGATGAAAAAGTSPKGDAGTAEFTVLSAHGYPESAKVQVTIKQLGAKAKEVLKTKSAKSSGGDVKFEHESARIVATADTQFQVSVKDHHTFGGGDELGEALLFVDDSSGSGSERTLEVGKGTVTLRTQFAATTDTASLRDSKSMRRSLLSKRDASRQGTPS